MLPVKAWVYGKLSADAALLALLGGASHVIDYEPEEKTFFPIVIFQKADESDTLFSDNMPGASDIIFNVDAYTKADPSMPTTTEIGIAVVNVLQPLLFSCRSRDVHDPGQLIRHLHMEFRRAVVAGDLV